MINPKIKGRLFAASLALNVALVMLLVMLPQACARRVKQEVRFRVMHELFKIAQKEHEVILPGMAILNLVNRATDKPDGSETNEYCDWLDRVEPAAMQKAEREKADRCADVTVVYMDDSEESKGYASQFVDLFKQAGWTVRFVAHHRPASEMGLAVEVHQSRHGILTEIPPGQFRLTEALKSAGIKYTLKGNPDVPSGCIWLVVLHNDGSAGITGA